MGFNFKKSINLGNNFRINTGKKGVGVSFGTKGIRGSLGASGSRITMSKSGFSYSTSFKSKKYSAKQNNAEASLKEISIGFLVFCCFGSLIYYFNFKIAFFFLIVVLILWFISFSIHFNKSNKSFNPVTDEASNLKEEVMKRIYLYGNRGVLQSDLVKEFFIEKSTTTQLYNIINELVIYGEITKEREGRSYRLFYIKKRETTKINDKK